MADDNSASFIPKRNPAKKIKRAVTRRVYLFTFLSYVALFVALILSGVLFGYKLILENRQAEQIQDLDVAIRSFSVADMERVVELDARIKLTEERVNNNLSTAALLAIIDASTVASVQFKDMNITRTDDTTVVLDANIVSPNFDSAIFQREIYQNSEELAGVTLTDIAFSIDGEVGASAATGGACNPRLGRCGGSTPAVSVDGGEQDPLIAMTAVFNVDADNLVFVPPPASPAANTALPSVNTVPVTETGTDSAVNGAVEVEPFVNTTDL